MHPMLHTAVQAARRAGSIINRASFDLDKLTVATKKHNDFVTEVDKAAEEVIIDTLLTAYPSHAVVAEESGPSSNLNEESEYVWFIDPLDGTTNFIHGFPQYAVSIALQHKKVLTQAVIYDPVHNNLFTATRGSGAFLNNKRLRVSKTDRLQDALVGTGFIGRGRDPEVIKKYLQMFELMAMSSHGLRRPGAATLDLASVAAGRFDGFFEKGLQSWDIAAGALLIMEAGGLIAGFTGETDYLQTGDVIAGNPRVFAQMLRLLKPFA